MLLNSKYIVLENAISPKEYQYLRQQAGWGEPDLADIEYAISKTLHFISIHLENEVIGCIRIVGDGKLCFYIQDLIVAKPYRLQGIGSYLFEKALEFIHCNAAYNAFVGLMAAKGAETIYKKYQFDIRPNSMLGPGMTRFWGREGEFSEE
jgi:predicted GNAT family N-acyltransferase